MSEPIGPGDWVECIDDSESPYYPGFKPLLNGALYCVERVAPAEEFVGNVDCYELTGVQHLDEFGRRIAYQADRFRPIRDGQERIVKKERVSA